MIYLVVLFLSFIITWLYKKYALHKSYLDIPNDRSSHSIPTPRGGGVAVTIAWLMGLLWLNMHGNIEKGLFYALIFGMPLSIIGMADDVFNLKPGIRFLVQVFSAGLAIYFLGGLKVLDLGLISIDLVNNKLGFYILNIVTFIAIIWLVNLFNFLDGIDGYLGTEIVFLGVAFTILSGDLIGIILISSVGGFLVWNWPKAKIFMGDVGSTLLGFVIAVLIIYFQNQQKISIISSMILTSVFWFDATITVLRRYLNNENLSQAHRKHAFQRIVQAGYSHQKTVLFSFVLNIVGFILAYFSIRWHSISVIFLIIDIAIVSYVYYLIERIRPFNVEMTDKLKIHS